ncbi:MAG TPA: hypothetical protein VNI57_14970, partial [Candidatus Saccharimonadales bacterium]|nr:hypothetical protein [Candidatus Saccharimonadales bacterium]
WRSRFRKDRLKQDYASDAKIPWLNFFDYNDPVAYSLEELQGLKETGTQANVSAPRCTDARKLFAITDIGFQRYPIPGKAHVDYWTDAGIQHQIIRLMGLTGEKPQPGQPSNVPWVMALRPLLIWGGYPVLRLLTFLAGLFFLNGLLRVFGNNPLGLQGPYESLVSGPFTSLESWNIVFWLLVPVLVMKVLVYAEFGRFFGVPWTRWIRWILAAAWVVLAVIICGGGRFGVAESGFLDFAGNLTGILGTVLFWKLHTAIHRGLVQLWYYTAEVL